MEFASTPVLVVPGDPSYCVKQARKTPSIPTHNSVPRRVDGHWRMVCLACGVAR